MINDLLEFLSDLKQQSIKLWIEGDQLRCNAPPGVLTPTLVDALRTHKTALLTYLRQTATVETTTIPVRHSSHTGPLPASFAQQQLWILDQLGQGAAYQIHLAVNLTGHLNITALQQALETIVQRHESLRTTFVQQEGQVLQIIQPVSSVTLSVTDIRHLPISQAQARVPQWLATEASIPFNLAQDLLLRARLLRLTETETLLLVTLHHIAADGWSMEVLTRELSVLYTAAVTRQPAPLAPLSIQYADFAIWQRQRLQGSLLEQQLHYWRTQLAEAPRWLNLPIAIETHTPPPVPLRAASVTFTLPIAVAQGLRDLSQQAGVTLFVTLLAAFQILLARYTGQEDLLVGTPVANRSHRQLEPLIGYFINTLVLRANLTGNPTVLEYLAQLRQTTIAAYEHQDLPFERLVEELQVERRPYRNPLVQVLFALQNAPHRDLTLSGLDVTPLELATASARMEMEIDCFEVGEQLRGVWVYQADRFEATAIERLVGHFQTLLAGMVATPTQRVFELPLLTSAERQQLLVDWNATAAAYPQSQCLHQLFEEQVERTPTAVAVVYSASPTSTRIASEVLTYRQLNQQANQLAHYLQAHGVGPDTFVGLYVKRSLAMVVGMLGILKAGGAYIPLDPDYPSERLAFILRDTQPSWLLTQADLYKAALCTPTPIQEYKAPLCTTQEPLCTQVLCLDTDWETHIASHSTANPTSAVTPQHLAYVIHTSGSTGQPKGVLIEHRSVVAHCSHYQRFYGLSPADRVLQLASFHFDASVEQLFPALLAGAQVVLPEWGVEPHSFSLQLLEYDITLIDISGIFWYTLLQEWQIAPALIATSALRIVIVGGDVMPATALPLWRQMPLSQRARLYNVYGPTETTVAATVYEVTADFPIQRTRIPIGKPLANRTAYVLDRHQQPVPIGVPGELYLGGIGLARGYLNQPALTQEKFVPEPSGVQSEALNKPSGVQSEALNTQTPTRLYRTGDLVCWLPEGDLDFLGRVDDQVKLQGYRIELGEIEAQLKRQPMVQDAAVVVQEEGEHKRLIGYIVRRHSSAASATVMTGQGESQWAEVSSTLRNALRTVLPAYMIPSEFIIVDHLPRLPTSGKVDKAALPKLTQEEKAKLCHPVAPRNPIEATLVAIWSEVLKRPEIGIHDSFFALGGHSLLATQVLSRIHQRFPLQLLPQHLFTYTTVAELATFIQTLELAQHLLMTTPPATTIPMNELPPEEGEL